MANSYAPTEYDISCPFCGEGFPIVVDPSEDHQSYIEDCYVCCRPILFTVTCNDGEVQSVEADRGT